MKKVTVLFLFFFVSICGHSQTSLKNRVLKSLEQYPVEDFSTNKYLSLINQQGIEHATLTLLDSLQSLKAYQLDSLWLPFRLLDKKSLFKESATQLVLNQYDSLYTSICLHFAEYLTTQNKYYLSTVYFAQCLEPYKSIYGFNSKQFIGLITTTGYWGLKGTIPLNPLEKYLRVSRIMAQNYYPNSQFFININFLIAKAYFEKHNFSLMDDVNADILECISSNENLRKPNNIDVISQLGDYYYFFGTKSPAAHNYKIAMELRLKLKEPFRDLEMNKSTYEIIKVSFFKKDYDLCLEVLNKYFDSDRIKSNSELKLRVSILLGQTYLAKKNYQKADSIAKHIISNTCSNEQCKFEQVNFLSEFYLFTKQYEKGKQVLLEPFKKYEKKMNFSYLSAIDKKLIWFMLKTMDSTKVRGLIYKHIDIYKLHLIGEDMVMNEGNKNAFRWRQMQTLYFFQNVLDELKVSIYDSIHYHIYDYLCDIKGSILSKKIDFSKIDTTNLPLTNERRWLLNEMKLAKTKIRDAYEKNMITDSLNFYEEDLYFIEMKLEREFRYMKISEPIWMYADSIAKNMDTTQTFINIFQYKVLDECMNETDTIRYAFYGLRKFEEDLGVLAVGSVNQEVSNEGKLGYLWNKLPLFFFNKGVKSLIISPDGIYNTINIGAIVQPNGRLLMEDYDIRIVTSARELIEQKEKKNYENTAVLVGNPTFNLSAPKQTALAANYTRSYTETPLFAWPILTRGSIAPLPNTKAEVENISKILQAKGFKTQTLLGEQALEEAVKSVKSPRILHIATHGFFEADVTKKDSLQADDFMGIQRAKAAENPLLRSGLLLAGAENYLKTKKLSNDHENGILTAYEAMNLDLENTELVVLSACETGLGEIKNGEGVYGLQRALRIAGAQSVLMSLWKVPDAPTKILMETFYDNWLTKGMNKHEALKQAQLSVRKMPQYTAPVNWAAFVLVE